MNETTMRANFMKSFPSRFAGFVPRHLDALHRITAKEPLMMSKWSKLDGDPGGGGHHIHSKDKEILKSSTALIN